MIELSTLAEIIGQNENLTVTMTEDGLLISDVNMNEKSNVPADLINFVSIYEKGSNIVPKGNGYVITTETFTGQTFMMLLMSVYSSEYNFEVTGDYEVTATKKSNEDKQDDKQGEEIHEEVIDFVALAESIDSSDVEIEIHEDGLKIECAKKLALAEKIDSLNPTLNIEITDEFVLVSTGE